MRIHRDALAFPFNISKAKESNMLYSEMVHITAKDQVEDQSYRDAEETDNRKEYKEPLTEELKICMAGSHLRGFIVVNVDRVCRGKRSVEAAERERKKQGSAAS